MNDATGCVFEPDGDQERKQSRHARPADEDTVLRLWAAAGAPHEGQSIGLRARLVAQLECGDGFHRSGFHRRASVENRRSNGRLGECGDQSRVTGARAAGTVSSARQGRQNKSLGGVPRDEQHFMDAAPLAEPIDASGSLLQPR